MDKKEILNNYSKPEDKLLIAKMIDKNEMSCAKNKIEHTDFLDEYQQNLLIKIIHKEKMLYYSHCRPCGHGENFGDRHPN